MKRTLVGWVAVGLAVAVVPAAQAAVNRCAARKRLCVAKNTAALLRCAAMAATPPGSKPGKLEACTQKAKAKFDGGGDPSKGCFARLEARFAGACATTADTAAVATEIAAFVGAIDGALAPPDFRPATCLDIRDAAIAANGVAPTDGAYTLYVDHDLARTWTAFCRRMQTTAPAAYLTVDESRNFSQIGNGTDLTTTTYRRLRIDPVTLALDLLDDTFATTQQGTLPPPGGRAHVPAGYTAFTSPRPDDGPPAQARIDLAGTGFVMAESVLANNLAFFCAVTNDGADTPAPGNGATAAVDLSSFTLAAIDPVAGSTTKVVADCPHLSVPDATITTGTVPLSYVGP